MDPDLSYDCLPKVKISKDFLKSNSSSHEFIFGAVAELVDNAYDAKAKDLKIWHEDAAANIGGTRLCFLDDGEGMSTSECLNAIVFGRTRKARLNGDTIGMYGNGLKSGSMRLGSDVILFSKKNDRLSCLFISSTFLEAESVHSISVPVPTFDARTRQPVIETESDESRHRLEMRIITEYSPYKDIDALLRQFDHIQSPSGTLVVIFNLRRSLGEIELDCHLVKGDMICKSSDQYKFGSLYWTSNGLSLKAYLSVLFSRPRMRIFINDCLVPNRYMVASLYQPMFYEFDLRRPQPTQASSTRSSTTTGRSSTTTSEPEQLRLCCGLNVFNPFQEGIYIYYRGRLVVTELIKAQRQSAFGQGELRGLMAIINIKHDVAGITLHHNKQSLLETAESRRLVMRIQENAQSYWGDAGYNHMNMLDFWQLLGFKPSSWDSHFVPLSTDFLKKRYELVDTWLQCALCRKWRWIGRHGFHFHATEKAAQFTCPQVNEVPSNPDVLTCVCAEQTPVIPKGVRRPDPVIVLPTARESTTAALAAAAPVSVEKQLAARNKPRVGQLPDIRRPLSSSKRTASATVSAATSRKQAKILAAQKAQKAAASSRYRAGIVATSNFAANKVAPVRRSQRRPASPDDESDEQGADESEQSSDDSEDDEDDQGLARRNRLRIRVAARSHPPPALARAMRPSVTAAHRSRSGVVTKGAKVSKLKANSSATLAAAKKGSGHAQVAAPPPSKKSLSAPSQRAPATSARPSSGSKSTGSSMAALPTTSSGRSTGRANQTPPAAEQSPSSSHSSANASASTTPATSAVSSASGRRSSSARLSQPTGMHLTAVIEDEDSDVKEIKEMKDTKKALVGRDAAETNVRSASSQAASAASATQTSMQLPFGAQEDFDDVDEYDAEWWENATLDDDVTDEDLFTFWNAQKAAGDDEGLTAYNTFTSFCQRFGALGLEVTLINGERKNLKDLTFVDVRDRIDLSRLNSDCERFKAEYAQRHCQSLVDAKYQELTRQLATLRRNVALYTNYVIESYHLEVQLPCIAPADAESDKVDQKVALLNEFLAANAATSD